MKITNLIFVFVIAFAVFASVSGVASAVIDAPLRPLSFGSPENLSALNIAKVTGTVPSDEFDVKTIRYEMDAAECSIHPVPDAQGYVYLKIGNLKPCTKPGEPQLPMKTFVIKLPKDTEVIGAEMTYGNYREIKNELNIVPMPEPVTWSSSEAEEANKYTENWADKKELIKKEQYPRYMPDEKVYSLSTYFPGKAVSYYVGCDNEFTFVYVRIYPVQYIPAKKKAILITDAEINVYYRQEEESFFRNDSGVSAMQYSESENVIITPPELFEQANRLKNFHDTKGIPTDVVNTTWIFSNYGNASDPPYEGYKNPSLSGWSDITGYNYTLAKRTVKYLKDTVEHPNLKYVTIFGNARLVPPSYYVYIAHGDNYNNWIPTDFFYASPDYDLFPNVMVGRLPVNSSAEAEHVVEKIENWDGNVSYDWFKNVSLAGGKPFIWDDKYYIGELITVDSVNRNYFNGMNVTEFFRTDGNFDKANLTDSLSGDTGMLYVITHGSGDSWSIEEDPINVDDLLSLPPNARVPIVVSIACMDGAFDTNVLYGGFDTSFGEGVLLSNASGIAYIGGSRVNYGHPISYTDQGNLRITKELYMAGMLTYVFRAYHEGANSLGSITREARKTYLLENDFCASDSKDNVTYFEFTLLGDPALQIPAQQAGPSYQTPNSTALNPEGYDKEDMPWYWVNENMTVTIRTTTNSPKVYTKHIIPMIDFVLNRIENSTVDNTFDYNFNASNPGYNLIRSASEDKKERWFYLMVSSARFNDVYSDYGEDTDGSGLYDYLVINVGVNVTEAGNYTVRGVLYENETQNGVTSGRNTTYLSEGNQTVQLRFKSFEIRKSKYNGTYDLKSLSLLYNGSITVDNIDYAYTTSCYNWTEFELPPAAFNDIYSDYGEDTGGDGLYNYLVINVGVNVTKAGNYTVEGDLNDKPRHTVDSGSNTTYLSEGNQTVQLRFKGFKLRMNEYNGTYDLKYLGLYNAEGEFLDGRDCAYTTSWYNWTEFELPVFDTGPGTYPSIFGTHNGTITPKQTITVSKMYAYPCQGTGGHSEYVRIWNSTLNVTTAKWDGYSEDWHNISFSESFTLVAGETYNYTIRTGSYPQIIHKQNHTTSDGSLITCKKFIDTNGKEYDDWIPAVRLWK